MEEAKELFEKTERLIVVVAHPDDFELLFGGTVARLTEAGKVAIVVNCTDGDIGTHSVQMTRQELSRLRRQEAECAGQVLGVETMIHLGYPDGELEPTLELRARLAECYRRYQPDTLLTFDPWWDGQAHPDHTAAGRAALDAYIPSKMPLYHPEQLTEGVELGRIEHVYLANSSKADLYVDISSVFERKIESLLCHKSQFEKPEEMREWVEKWNRENGEKAQVQYAEIFRKMFVW
jgi:LmbE family N-acetylglucosaminyl deacetylase